jgi:hypothetical protein
MRFPNGTGACAVGLTPFLSLSTVSLGTLAVAATARAPWAAAELASFLEKRNQAQQHGMYYLLKFRQ